MMMISVCATTSMCRYRLRVSHTRTHVRDRSSQHICTYVRICVRRYDACGVRLQAGKHAEALNHIVSATSGSIESDDVVSTSTSGVVEAGDSSVSIDMNGSNGIAKHRKQTAAGLMYPGLLFPLTFYEKKFKESIGHTPLQVVMGALTGFLVPYAVFGTRSY